MKRSEEARLKMSEAKKGKPSRNKGMIRIKNDVNHHILIPKDSVIPDGYKKIVMKKAVDSNGVYKMFDSDNTLPEGWKWVCNGQ